MLPLKIPLGDAQHAGALVGGVDVVGFEAFSEQVHVGGGGDDTQGRLAEVKEGVGKDRGCVARFDVEVADGEGAGGDQEVGFVLGQDHFDLGLVGYERAAERVVVDLHDDLAASGDAGGHAVGGDIGEGARNPRADLCWQAAFAARAAVAGREGSTKTCVAGDRVLGVERLDGWHLGRRDRVDKDMVHKRPGSGLHLAPGQVAGHRRIQV